MKELAVVVNNDNDKSVTVYETIDAVKKAGFNMAFIGQYNTNGFSTPGKTNKYKVPRKTIFSSTTMTKFKELLK